MSVEILKSLMVDTAYQTKTYKVLYSELERVITEPSNGLTRVRFVSRSLRNRHDDRFKHVFLEFQRGTPMRKRRENKFDEIQVYVSEHAPVLSYLYEEAFETDWRDELSIQLPNITHEFDTIRHFDEMSSDLYILGLHDCRHHTMNMLNFCYPKD